MRITLVSVGLSLSEAVRGVLLRRAGDVLEVYAAAMHTMMQSSSLGGGVPEWQYNGNKMD